MHDTLLDWEDALPEAEFTEAEARCDDAALVIVLGSSLRIEPAGSLPARAAGGAGGEGQYVIVNLQTTPKVSLFFISFFPSFLFLPKQPIWLQFYALGAIFIAISSLGFIVLALLASRFFKAQKSNHSFFRVIHWVQIILFIGIGIFILLP